jgi:hypothetical protein
VTSGDIDKLDSCINQLQCDVLWSIRMPVTVSCPCDINLHSGTCESQLHRYITVTWSSLES